MVLSNRQEKKFVSNGIFIVRETASTRSMAKVRLRDVHDLFMDTGLGRDSFSIISQGRVEEIFNSKPEERRAIFEEAAGVLKFKTRRKGNRDQTQPNPGEFGPSGGYPLWIRRTNPTSWKKQATVARRFLEYQNGRFSCWMFWLLKSIWQRTFMKRLIKKKRPFKNSWLHYQRRQVLEEDNVRIKKPAISWMRV